MTPEGWSSLTIGDVAVFVGSGITPRGGSAVYRSSGIPFLRSQNIHFGGLRLDDVAFVEATLHAEMSRTHVQPGDVLLNITGASIGRCTVAPSWLGPANVNQHVCIIRCPPDWAEGGFVAFYLASPLGQNDIDQRQAGLSREALNYEQVRALRVLLPPLPEQRKIAAILSSVDEAIEATQAVIGQLQVVKKAMMAELLTRGIPGRHTKFKMTEIGEVPEGWEVRPIGDLVESCDYGLSKALRTDANGVAVLRMGNLCDGRVSLKGLKYISGREVSPGLLLESGDVLFNRTNSKDLVGKVGVYEGSNSTVSFASYLLRLRPKRPKVTGHWLGALMNLDANQAAFRVMATPGVSQVNVNRTKMLSLLVPVPPLSEQEELVHTDLTLLERLRTEQRSMDQMAALKSALSSVLLTGELRVRPDGEAT